MIYLQVPVRQMLVHDTWAARDLPVLDATIGLLEQSYMVTVTDIAARTGFDPSVVAQALEALDPVYVDFRKTTTGGDPRFWYVFKVTPEARRAVGQWPTAEALATRLAEELATAAGADTDAEHQGLLAYAARLIGDTLRDATVRAAGAVLAPAFGGVPVPEMGHPVPPPAPRADPDFVSLVPLPELPELLRPERPDDLDQTASPEDQARSPEDQARSPEDQAASPEDQAASPRDQAASPAVQPEPTAPKAAPEAMVRRDRAAAVRAEPQAAVPDLNPWPEQTDVADQPPAAQDLAPLPEPTSFPSSLAPVPAAVPPVGVADPDAADTDLDLAQSRGDAANAL